MAGGSPKTVGVTNPLKIFSNIFISFIGAGVLGLPYAFKEAGVLEGIIVMTVVAVFSCKAMLMVIECKYEVLRLRSRKRFERYSSAKHSTSNGELTEVKLPLIYGESDSEEDEAFWRDDEFLSYGDIGYYALGNTGRSLVDFAIIVSQIGFCCAYLIFITENLASYIPSVAKTQWLVIILPPLFLISLLRQLDRLAFFSLFAQLTNIFAFTVVFWFDFQHYHTVRFRPREFSVKGFPLYFAIAIYCYEGAGMILSLEHSLAQQLRPKFKNYFLFTMVIVTSLYITFGASGYLSFGPATKEIITMNLPHSGDLDFAVLVKLCLSLALFCTYPIMLFPVVQLLETRCTPTMTPSQQVWLQNMYRVVLVSITGLIVVVVPNFAHLMALVGATCCTLLAFILPALFHIMIFKNIQTFKRCLLNLLIILIGLSALVIGTMDAVDRMGERPHDLDRDAADSALVRSTTPISNTSLNSAQRHFFVSNSNSSNVSSDGGPHFPNMSLPNQSFNLEEGKGVGAKNSYFSTSTYVDTTEVGPVLPESLETHDEWNNNIADNNNEVMDTSDKETTSNNNEVSSIEGHSKPHEDNNDSSEIVASGSNEEAISNNEETSSIEDHSKPHEGNNDSSEIIGNSGSNKEASSNNEETSSIEDDSKQHQDSKSENPTPQNHDKMPSLEDNWDNNPTEKNKNLQENPSSKSSEENLLASLTDNEDSSPNNASKLMLNAGTPATSNGDQLLDNQSPTSEKPVIREEGGMKTQSKKSDAPDSIRKSSKTRGVVS